MKVCAVLSPWAINRLLFVYLLLTFSGACELARDKEIIPNQKYEAEIKLDEIMKWGLLFSAWLVALVSTLGSLFFSEVMKYPPCVLCWYQRICMYPLVLLLFTGMFPFDRNVVRYSLPLAAIGAAVGLYHNLLYYKILPESASPCIEGVSCTTVHFVWNGFVTIPFLSLSGFSIIIFILLMLRRSLLNEK